MNTNDLKIQFEEDNRKFLDALPHCLDGCSCSPEAKDHTLAIAQHVFDKMREIQDLVIGLAGNVEQTDT